MNKRSLVAIVDDEKAVCRAIGRLVTSAGLEAESFSSAKEFLQSRRERVPDCLILNLRLPGMSGFELQQQLATDDRRIPNGVDDMSYMYSLNATSNQQTTLLVDFDLKTDPNTDLLLTQSREQLATGPYCEDL